MELNRAPFGANCVQYAHPKENPETAIPKNKFLIDFAVLGDLQKFTSFAMVLIPPMISKRCSRGFWHTKLLKTKVNTNNHTKQLTNRKQTIVWSSMNVVSWKMLRNGRSSLTQGLTWLRAASEPTLKLMSRKAVPEPSPETHDERRSRSDGLQRSRNSYDKYIS